MQKRIAGFLFSFLIILLLLTPAHAFEGEVIGVTDGDTISVLYQGKPVKIRLYGVDSPEKRQPYGTKAKQFTSDQVFGKWVDVDPVDQDRYGRTVGIVKVDGKVLNRELVAAGYAWVYDRYCKRWECSELKRLEEQAREYRRGLWREPAVPPWEWRKS
jgi:micrococcal nuclease